MKREMQDVKKNIIESTQGGKMKKIVKTLTGFGFGFLFILHLFIPQLFIS
jgi:hypothetical protein